MRVSDARPPETRPNRARLNAGSNVIMLPFGRLVLYRTLDQLGRPAAEAKARSSRSISDPAPGQPDVVLAADVDGTARFELVEEGAARGDAVVSTDPAHRLLALWGRRSSKHPLTIEAEEAISDAVSSVLWPSATPWC
jgi:hypothetical protein